MKKTLLLITLIYVFFACSNDDPTPVPEKKIGITSFSIEPSINGSSTRLTGKFNADSTIISFETKKWIDNIGAIVAKFEARGTVKVNGVEQTSELTANDFRNEIIYTIVGEDNSTREYKVVLKSPQASGLPVINVETEGGKAITSKKDYVNAVVVVSDVNNPDFNIDGKTVGIRGRGNTTWNYEKKPYRIKFDKRTSMFGYGAAKSWVLLANYLDPTFIMNTVAFELGHRFDLEYTNHPNHVEFYLNGEYKGSYVLTEQVQVDKERVNIDEDTDFLVELDTYFDEDYQFKTDIIKLPVMIKSPELDSNAGMDFVKKALKDLEDALFDPAQDFPNNNYQDLIDVNSLINFLMVNDLVGNTELQHPKSMYMYKRAGEKIKMGPLWDFDWGFGGNGSFTYFAKTDILCKPNYTGSQIGYKFFRRFFDDPDFRTKYKARWNEVYQNKISTIDTFIDQMSEKLQKSQVEDCEIWKKKWEGNANYNTQISSMKKWLNDRMLLMNTEINKY